MSGAAVESVESRDNLLGLTAAEAKAMLADPLMILVNHTNQMPENYTFETAECGSKTAVNKTLQTVACNAFLELQKAAAAENVTVWMQSGYRSVSYQTNLYEKKTNYYKQQGYDDATEITYEPWHWRYVGVENAAKINASGLCFEDYIAALQQIAG